MPANQPYDYAFWTDEVARSERESASRHSAWQDNLNYYTGTPLSEAPSADYVNVNVDFYQVEQKGAQLFFECPELQVTAGAGFEGTEPGVLAFRALLNALLSPDYSDALQTVLKAIKDCTATAGFGPTIIGYQPTIQPVTETPQPGAILGLSQSVPVPVHEAWFWDRIPVKKFLIPADFYDTHYDKAPWLGMRVRVPLKAARLICDLPPDFEGTTTKDDKVLESGPNTGESTSLAYVDLVIVWYKAYLFDDDVIHPEIYRRHVIVDGLETFADRPDPMWKSPYQTLLPNGRLSADSMIGNPIHPLTLREVPDSAYVPSDSQMTRPLVKELCLFRTQMVKERDINTPKFAYDAIAVPPDAIAKIEQAMTGSLIPLPDAAFTGGLDHHFVQLSQGSSPRQTYLANDYITKDIEKTLGLDSAGLGVEEDTNETATKTAEVAKSRNVRLDAERKRALRWYLKGVDKVAALALRFCNDPARVAELIGPQMAQAYLMWREAMLQAGDVRPKFTAKPDSQIKLDAAQEWRTTVQLYEFVAKDPMANRAPVLRKLFTLRGLDPTECVVEPPDEKPEPSVGYAFKGEDLNPLMPQFPLVIEVLTQLGIEISEDAIAEAQAGAQTQMQAQMLMAEMQPTGASGKPAAKKPAGHGGLADKAGPLSKHVASQTGERPGPSVS